jgi:hypothetical protein
MTRRSESNVPRRNLADTSSLERRPPLQFSEFENSIHDVIMVKQAIHEAKRGRGSFWMNFTYKEGDVDVWRPKMFELNGFKYAIARAAKEGRIEYIFGKRSMDPNVTTIECCRVNQAMDIIMHY